MMMMQEDRIRNRIYVRPCVNTQSALDEAFRAKILITSYDPSSAPYLLGNFIVFIKMIKRFVYSSSSCSSFAIRVFNSPRCGGTKLL
jgi:hypothetical protein